MADTKTRPEDKPEVVVAVPPFSEFETLAVSVVLDDSLVRLNLLKHVIGGERGILPPNPGAAATSGKANALSLRPLQSQQQQLSSSVVRQHSNQRKLERARHQTYEILEATLTEIKQRGSFSILQNDVRKKQLDRAEEDDIFVREAELKKTLVELSEHLIALRRNAEVQLRSRDEEIVKLKTCIQGVKRAWKEEEPKIILECDDKIEKHNAECIEREESLWRQIKDLKTNIEEELKSHEEITTFLENCKKELKWKCDQLCVKYDGDLSQMEEHISGCRAKTEAVVAESIRLTAVFEDYTKVIEENREYEEKQNQQMVLFIKETAAVKIQKWWRLHTMTQRMEAAQKKKKKAPKKKR